MDNLQIRSNQPFTKETEKQYTKFSVHEEPLKAILKLRNNLFMAATQNKFNILYKT